LLCGYFSTNGINKYFGGIHVEKLGTYMIKDLTNIGMEVVCNFSNLFLSLEAICHKMV
jgi:hypothetical protein